MKRTGIFLLVLFLLPVVPGYGKIQVPQPNLSVFQEELPLPETGLKIFPNPVKENKFTISAQETIKEIHICNIMGQKTDFSLQNKDENIFHVIFNHKKQGIYLVTVIFEGQIKEVKRIVVN